MKTGVGAPWKTLLRLGPQRSGICEAVSNISLFLPVAEKKRSQQVSGAQFLSFVLKTTGGCGRSFTGGTYFFDTQTFHLPMERPRIRVSLEQRHSLSMLNSNVTCAR